jgi:uncharacterized protein (TIGR00159 family)
MGKTRHSRVFLFSFMMDYMSVIAVADIIVFSFLAYGIIRLLQQTRAVFVVLGIAIICALYAVAQWFGLTLTVASLNLFFSVFFIGLVIIFQAELRRYFEMVALWSGSWRGRAKRPGGAAYAEAVIAVAERCAAEKTGMLAVFSGNESIARHCGGGFALNGIVSEPILESIFDASSPGHDGAVIIENGGISKFGVHLLLSKDFKQIETYGTRHSAGLGIAEVSDALAVVVSEEKGTISIAKNGVLTNVSAERLRDEIRLFLREKFGKRKRAFESIYAHIPEKALAVLIAVAAWFAFAWPYVE